MEKTAPVYFTYLPNGNLRHSQSGLEYRYLQSEDPCVECISGAISIIEPETFDFRWVVPV